MNAVPVPSATPQTSLPAVAASTTPQVLSICEGSKGFPEPSSAVPKNKTIAGLLSRAEMLSKEDAVEENTRPSAVPEECGSRESEGALEKCKHLKLKTVLLNSVRLEGQAGSSSNERHVSPDKRTRLDGVAGKPPVAEKFGKKNSKTSPRWEDKYREPEKCDLASQLADTKRNHLEKHCSSWPEAPYKIK
ncbi:hypothetical protein MRX96_031765 [Rhipicephalus microplus]